MHFGDVICTCLHSKCWRQHCLHYYVQLLALVCAVACTGCASFRYRETEKNVGLTEFSLPLCCFGALAQANKLYLLTSADKNVYETLGVYTV